LGQNLNSSNLRRSLRDGGAGLYMCEAHARVAEAGEPQCLKNRPKG
jgi:hypothetical protein